jgi:Cu(I)/Ag(I) efflux system membrane protein CusA/SilA
MPLFFVIGNEFMPPLNEGSILYMPTTPPGISVTEASKLLQVQDRILRSFPEVVTVFGKAGRAETATDPAPYSMMETVVVLKPQNQWRKITKHGWARLLPPRRIKWKELIAEMDAALQLPGQVNAWTMPIKARIDMLTTGVRTPVGIKIYGDDLTKVEMIGRQIESLLKPLKGTRSVYAERTAGGYFVDFELKRDQIARYGLNVEDVQITLMFAVGGENVTTTVEGRERFPVNVRYPRELRDDVEKLKRVYIATPSGASVPVSQLADVKTTTGPSMIRDENGRLTGYVYCDIDNRDIGSWVNQAKRILKKQLSLPSGYSLAFSGQYELMQRVAERMRLVLPLTLFAIFLLLYWNTRSAVKTFIVLLAVPFSLIGVIWALFLLGYNMSIAVWAGIIALLGVDAETGVFMLLFLDLSYEESKRKGLLKSEEDLQTAIIHGAVKRIRPKLMTALVLFVGLLPIMGAQSHEIGADVMKRIAAPMVGGVLVSFLMELAVYPAIYLLWKRRELKKLSGRTVDNPVLPEPAGIPAP